MDDADLGNTLAGGLAVPEGFKEGEVSPEEEEWNKDEESFGPFFADFAVAGQAGVDQGDEEDHKNERGEPDEVIDEEGDEAAAEAGDGEVDGDEFRRVDAELVPFRDRWVGWVEFWGGTWIGGSAQWETILVL